MNNKVNDKEKLKQALKIAQEGLEYINKKKIPSDKNNLIAYWISATDKAEQTQQKIKEVMGE